MNPIEFRRHLHRYPERSFEEYRTAAFIGEQLTALGILHRPIARTGILATITGRRTPGEAPAPAQETETATATAGPAALFPSASPLKPSADRPSTAPAAAPPRRAVVLRADIDALPIEECTGLPYASEHPGVMHACGHDLHAAVLYGVLQRLATDPDFDGTVLGLFQPGEECNPGGASLVLAEEPFAGYDVAAVIGEHCEWQLPVGTLGFRAGKYMASSDELRFNVVGRGGHGAQRATLVDPVAAAAALVTRLLALNTPERLLSIGRIEADGATNVIPDDVRLEGTLRTFDEADRRATHARIAAEAAAVDALHATRTAVAIGHGYPCVVNDPELAERAAALARRRGERVEWLDLRFTAEDFGFYTQRYPALFYRLGVGPDAGRSHTAHFAPSEEAIARGIDFMTALALEILKA